MSYRSLSRYKRKIAQRRAEGAISKARDTEEVRRRLREEFAASGQSLEQFVQAGHEETEGKIRQAGEAAQREQARLSPMFNTASAIEADLTHLKNLPGSNLKFSKKVTDKPQGTYLDYIDGEIGNGPEVDYAATVRFRTNIPLNDGQYKSNRLLEIIVNSEGNTRVKIDPQERGVEELSYTSNPAKAAINTVALYAGKKGKIPKPL